MFGPDLTVEDAVVREESGVGQESIRKVVDEDRAFEVASGEERGRTPCWSQGLSCQFGLACWEKLPARVLYYEAEIYYFI